MGIEGIIRKIDKEAQEESSSLIEEAEKEASSILSGAKKELAIMLDELNRKLAREKERTRNIHISEGKRKARQTVLEMKESLIEETISSIRESMRELEGKELSELLSVMYSRAVEELGDDMTVHPVRQLDEKALGGEGRTGPILENTNDLPWQISRLKGKDLVGGFVAVASGGKRVLDMSFNGLMERDEDRIREMISRTLFTEEKE